MRIRQVILHAVLLLILAARFESVKAEQALPAFPGAEGFGAANPGGRGGRVIKVTSLASSGPGSLAWACSQEGPRIVVFEVSGVIEGDVIVRSGRISILGQTAPGAGITIKGMLRSAVERRGEKIEDIVVRFLRVRPDSNQTLSQQGDAIQFSAARRVMIDHCSSSWASDETIDVFQADDVTVQWCTVEDGDIAGHEEGVHNYGLIQGPDGHRITVHHTLFAHQKRRCPAIANGPADVVNNVVYNFRDGFLHDNPVNDSTFNIVANYYKVGPNDPDIFPFCFGEGFYYLRDNFIEGVGLLQDPWAEKDRLRGLAYYAGRGHKAGNPAVTPPVTTQSAGEAYELVLSQAGAFPRDFITRRCIGEVRSATGTWGRRAIPDLLRGLAPAAPPRDSDDDGLPDAWETSHGLNPADGIDCNKVMDSGYTAIEEYCNERAAGLIGK
ncbi:MAG: pectate lyase precursor [Candidatus Glassbacteria bacterium]